MQLLQSNQINIVQKQTEEQNRMLQAYKINCVTGRSVSIVAKQFSQTENNYLKQQARAVKALRQN